MTQRNTGESGVRSERDDGSTIPLLKGCPFCGDSALLQGLGEHNVICTNCSVLTPDFPTAEEAIAAWNLRPEPSPDAPTFDLGKIIYAIQETETPMPRLYRQGWEDACNRCAEAARDYFARSGNGLVRKVDASQAVTSPNPEDVELGAALSALAGNGYRIVPAEPSPEDVERVARAICCPSGHCHIVEINERAETALHYPQPWPCCWQQHEERARAALSALGRGCK